MRMMEPGTSADPNAARLERILLASPIIEPVIRQWADLTLPDCWLAAGAVTQTVWNDLFGHDPGYGMTDSDLIYFDGSDLSENAEASHAARIGRLFAACG